jgi:hypothetical protein
VHSRDKQSRVKQSEVKQSGAEQCISNALRTAIAYNTSNDKSKGR